MRISDWSSDVCSSDLPPQACLGEGDRLPQAVGGGASASSVKPLHQLRWSPSSSKLGEERVGLIHRWAAHRAVTLPTASSSYRQYARHLQRTTPAAQSQGRLLGQEYVITWEPRCRPRHYIKQYIDTT